MAQLHGRLVGMAAIFLLLLAGNVAFAREARPLTPESAKEYVEETFGAAFKRGEIPGAAIAIVSGGKTVYLGGVGYSDAVAKTPFDPKTTLVNIASISKTMTGTAIMRARRDGIIWDLDADVPPIVSNDVSIDGKPVYSYVPSGPVTFVDLLTHSAGFEDKLMGLFARDPSQANEIEAFEPFPSRVRHPKEAYAYSNHGIALAALATEKLLHNESFPDYVRRVVFDPLDMADTTMLPENAEDPVAKKLAAGKLALARGHIRQEDGWSLTPSIHLRAVAAGNVVTTAADMAKYMTFHLAPPAANGVLPQDDVELMRRPHFRNHPGLRASAGLSWQLFEISDDATLVSHAGDYLYAKSFCGIVPEKNVGLFFNIPRVEATDAEGAFKYNVVASFLQRFVDPSIASGRAIPPQSAPPENINLHEFEGVFAHARRAYMNVEYLLLDMQLRRQVRVVAEGDSLVLEDMTGSALSNLGWASTAVKLVPVDEEGAKDLFRVVPREPGAAFDADLSAQLLRNDPRVAFGRAANGTVRYIFFDQGFSAFATYDRPSFYENYGTISSLVLPALGLQVAYAAFALPGIVRWWARRKGAAAADEKKETESELAGGTTDATGSSTAVDGAGSARRRKAPTKVAEDRPAEPPQPAPEAQRPAGPGPDPVDPASNPYDNEYVPQLAAGLALMNTAFVGAFALIRSLGPAYFLTLGSNRLPFFMRMVALPSTFAQFFAIPLLTQLVMGTLAWIQRRSKGEITIPASEILPLFVVRAVLAASGMFLMLWCSFFNLQITIQSGR
ncbi:beta-lactamase/transpeptidase-like protein [Hyaloraphidium curvatum]|nr:beta-lactamase/transpeptidase-like protein [Hyaloraphidium curvatum]